MSNKYTQTPLYGHPLNMDTSLLRIDCFVPEERKTLHFLFNSTRLKQTLPRPPQCLYKRGLTVDQLYFGSKLSITG